MMCYYLNPHFQGQMVNTLYATYAQKYMRTKFSPTDTKHCHMKDICIEGLLGHYVCVWWAL